MNPQTAYHLEPQTGTAFVLRAGQVLRIIDPEGEQVAEPGAFAADDAGVWLSSGRTFDYNNYDVSHHGTRAVCPYRRGHVHNYG